MIRNEAKSAQHAPARHSLRHQLIPVDRRDPGALFIEQEIEADRRREHWLWLKAVVAIVLVGVLIVVRQVFFA